MAHSIETRLATTKGDVGQWLTCGAMALVLAVTVGVASSRCAQVTLAFEANVASVLSTNGGANLPFNVSAGDPLNCTFAFEPAMGGPLYPQSGVLRFLLGGETLEIAGYEIVVRDEDAPNASPITGTIADPPNTPIVDQGPGSSDNIVVSCLSGHDLYCGSIVGRSEVLVWPVVHFSTDANVLDSNNLVADLTVWNEFSFREMSLSFKNSETGGETYIGANIGAVSQVPEAGTFSMALTCAISLVTFSLFRCPWFVQGKKCAL